MKDLNVSKGNMYEWVTHMWSPISGCPHQCSYCYVRNRFSDLSPEPLLKPKPWPVLGQGRVIFVGHLCDMFAEAVGDDMILSILEHCLLYPENQYVFQTKNTRRLLDLPGLLPRERILGTTIETNRRQLLASISRAPPPSDRACGLGIVKSPKFLTIEPIMDFDLGELLDLIRMAEPDFVNIGADSKQHGLPEPTYEKVLALIGALQKAGISIRKKTNLDRLAPSCPRARGSGEVGI